MNMNELLSKDKECGMPNLIPGDTIRMKSGTVAVITKSKVTINGCSLSWYDDLPKDIRHGHKPSYSLSIVGNRLSWYTTDDFKEVLGLSLLRDTEGFKRLNNRKRPVIKPLGNSKKITCFAILTDPTYSLKISSDDFMSKENIAITFNTTMEKVEEWIISGVEGVIVDDIPYINYGSVCDLIASGRA